MSGSSADVRIAWLDARFVMPGAATRDLGRFDRSDHASLFGNFGIPRYARITPVRAIPTNGLYQRLNGGFFAGRNAPSRPPFSARSAEFSNLQINSAGLDVFPGRVVVSEVAAKYSTEYGSDFAAVVKTLKDIRSPRSVPLVNHYLEEMGQTILSPFPSADVRQKYFVAEVNLPEPVDRLARVVSDAQRQAVAALIGADEEGYLSDTVVDRVFETSAELNAKSSGEVLLLNRQGALLIRARGKYLGPHRGRYNRLRELATIGLYARTFLRDSHYAASPQAAEAYQWIRRIEQWVNHSQVIFDTSVSNTVQWQSISTAFLLRERLDAWHEFHSHDAGLHFVSTESDGLIDGLLP